MADKTYPWAYWGERKTLAQMNVQWKWYAIHPEMRRRLIAMFDAHPTNNLGCGGGARTSESQLQLFLSRYTPVSYATYLLTASSKRVNWPEHAQWGQSSRYWKLVTGASAAPPGYSYHEPTTSDGYALAIDTIGWTDGWQHDHCEEYGLKDFLAVNGEEWHLQPVEIPNSRRNYNGEKLEVWPLPNQPQEDPPVIGFRKRLMDTRPLPSRILAGQQVTVDARANGVPASAKAVLVRIQALESAGPGYLNAWPGGPRPDTAEVNYDPVYAPIWADTSFVDLDLNGRFVVSPMVNATHFIVDLQAYQ